MLPPLGLWTQLRDCPCPLACLAYLPSLSSASMHGTTAPISRTSVSRHRHDQANTIRALEDVPKIHPEDWPQTNNWGSLVEWDNQRQPHLHAS